MKSKSGLGLVAPAAGFESVVFGPIVPCGRERDVNMFPLFG